MNQRKYALKLISELGLSAGKPSWTPLEYNQKLTTKELDVATGEQDDEALEDRDKYQRLIGKPLYLTMTRLDIAFAVQTLSQFLQAPKKSHWEAVLKVVNMRKGNQGLEYLRAAKRAIS